MRVQVDKRTTGHSDEGEFTCGREIIGDRGGKPVSQDFSTVGHE